MPSQRNRSGQDLVLGPLPRSAGAQAHERPPAAPSNLTRGVRSRMDPKGPICFDGTVLSLP